MYSIIDFANHFGLRQFYISEESCKREISISEVDRPGLEMSGFFDHHCKDRIVIIGNKEMAYLNTLSYEKAYEAFIKICSKETPGIVLCQDYDCPEVILNACKATDCPLFGTSQKTGVFEAQALMHLSEVLAPRTSLHGNFMEVFGEGVLLLGESGIGKSEICLDLIKKGHILVSDDKVLIKNVRGKLIGKAPEVIFGMMEVRGIGFIDVSRVFGINSLARSSSIKYCIQLVPFDPLNQPNRAGVDVEYKTILGKQVPLITVPVSPARSMSEIVEVAVTNLKLKEYGFDSSYEFEKRLEEYRSRKD